MSGSHPLHALVDDAAKTERIDFEGLDISWDRRVLRPRAWTAEQGRWAAELARTTPSGPILELCCGAGHIGLLAARLSGRRLVQVDRDPVAAAYARHNAAAAGIRTEVRCGSVDDVLLGGESFGLVLADPPWLRSDDVADWPEDPLGAVDGGPDGCEVIVVCIDAGLAHLAPGGHLVLQVGTESQVARVRAYLAQQHPQHTVCGVRDCRPGGILMDIARSDSHDESEKGTGQEQEGQVSEVSSMAEAGETTPGDAVAGHPSDDAVDEGMAGPDAPTGDQDHQGEPR